jgi:hypothetical protein
VGMANIADLGAVCVGCRFLVCTGARPDALPHRRAPTSIATQLLDLMRRNTLAQWPVVPNAT